mgnify:CR=1 FL=1
MLSKVRRSDHDVRIKVPDTIKVEGRPVLLLDDICTSGGTLATAAHAVLAHGASSVDAIITHAIFGKEAIARLTQAGVRTIQSCDSCLHPTNAIPLASLLADAVRKEWS